MKPRKMTALRKSLVVLNALPIFFFVVSLFFLPFDDELSVFAFSMGHLTIIRSAALFFIEQGRWGGLIISLWLLISPLIASCFVFENKRRYRWLTYPTLVIVLGFSLLIIPVSLFLLVIDGITMTVAVLVDREMKSATPAADDCRLGEIEEK